MQTYQFTTKAKFINDGFRLWGHLFLYDFEELKNALLDVGFKEVYLCDYRTSIYKELCGLESRPYYRDLIIEAKK